MEQTYRNAFDISSYDELKKWITSESDVDAACGIGACMGLYKSNISPVDREKIVELVKLGAKSKHEFISKRSKYFLENEYGKDQHE